MKKQYVMPLSVLRDFWKTGDVTSLDWLTFIEVKSKSVGGRVHDLTHYLAMHEAEQMEGTSWDLKWYRKLVDRYPKEREVAEAVVENQGAQASDGREQYFSVVERRNDE